MAKLTNRSSGQHTVELICGLVFIVPIMLLLVNLGCMMLASAVNDNLAKRAARAAANQYPPVAVPPSTKTGDPQAAALNIINSLPISGIFYKLEELDIRSIPPTNLPAGQYCLYNDPAYPGYVVVTTRLTIKVPVPVFIPELASFTTSSQVPIVALAAQ